MTTEFGIEPHYAAIVESSEDAIISKDLRDIITAWNPAAERLFGYTRQEAVGQPITMLLPADRIGEELEITAQILRGVPNRFESIRRRKDGTSLEVSVAVSPVRDREGNLIGAAKMLRDISAEKLSERQMRESLREITSLKAALDEHAIVAITDVRGDITYVNDKFCAISKYPREELLGKNHRIINSGYHPKEFFVDLWATISSGRVWKGHIRNRARDGSLYWVATTIVPFLNEKGKPLQYVSVRTDITEHVLAVKTLTERDEALTRSNAALQEFAYVASHDLQEPLRGVSGCMQMLQKFYSGKLDERADEFIRHAVQNVERMEKLILSLLDYTRIDRDWEQLGEVDCLAAVRDALANLSVAIAESGATINVAELPVIAGDRAQIARLFQNLLGNAIKFRGPEPPVIRISAERSGPKASWTFTVGDNGIGFEPRHATRIFGIFQRLHSRSKYQGTGIGLAICRKIVERHRGRIWVESKPGKGSAFFFTLRGLEEA